MDKTTTLILVGFGAVALYFITRPATPQQPVIIQQAPQPQQQQESGGAVSDIFGGIGRVIDGIIEVAK